MWQEAVGDPWSVDRSVEAAGDATWVNVCALTRTDFPPETLAALARDGRQLLVDAQGLVRTATLGPLQRDEHIGDVLGHIEVLKLNDDEAKVLVGSAEPERLQRPRRSRGGSHARLARCLGRDARADGARPVRTRRW